MFSSVMNPMYWKRMPSQLAPRAPELENSDIPEDETHVQLFELTSLGFDGPQTLKLVGEIMGTRLVLMVDKGASHCFISERIVQQLQCPIKHISSFPVTLGDGSKVHVRGLCKNLPLLLNSKLYNISCYVFPLGGVDLILGVSWLAKLGEIKVDWTNWAKPPMEFTYNSRVQRLDGDPTLARRVCNRRELCSLELGDQGWILWSMVGESVMDQFGISENLSEAAMRDISFIIASFPTVIAKQTRLSPSRANDHHIVLPPGSQQISMRLYRCNHIQEDEMERLVVYMLAAGIIQSSNNPYSSPVLLVCKKDGSWHFCVDYRELNKVTVPNKYPIM